MHGCFSGFVSSSTPKGYVKYPYLDPGGPLFPDNDTGFSLAVATRFFSHVGFEFCPFRASPISSVALHAFHFFFEGLVYPLG